MADSPYAPPRSTVSDAAPREPVPPRPARVTHALRWLWIGLAADTATSLWALLDWRGGVLLAGVLAQGAFVALSAWFYIGVARGRNWARWASAVLTGFTLLIIGLSLFEPQVPKSRADQVSDVTDWITIAISICALYFLFTGSARAWFAQMGEHK